MQMRNRRRHSISYALSATQGAAGHRRRGYSKGPVITALVIGLLIGLLIGALATYALAESSLSRTTTATSVSTTTTTLPAVTSTTTLTLNQTQEVDEAFAGHLRNVESHNATALAADYENNATIYFFGCTFGLGGLQTGKYDIELLYQIMFSQEEFGAFNVTDIRSSAFVGPQSFVNATFGIQGNSTNLTLTPPALPYSEGVRSDVTYSRVGDLWLISSDSWDFSSPSGSFTSGACD
jgi:hypothetical protein